jgi:hypothetical protein
MGDDDLDLLHVDHYHAPVLDDLAEVAEDTERDLASASAVDGRVR